MNVERLNINVGGVRALGFTGSDAAFSALESAAQGDLPASYIAFLRAVDGGHPEVGSFSLQDGAEDELFDVDWFYAVAAPGVPKLQDALASWGPVLGPGALPIARDGGGNQIYFRLAAPEPSVWLYLHDADLKEHKVADGFEQFLDGLRENPDFI